MDLKAIAFTELIFVRIKVSGIYFGKFTASKKQILWILFLQMWRSKQTLRSYFEKKINCLADYKIFFRFKDTVKVDWSFACQFETFILQIWTLKSHLDECSSIFEIYFSESPQTATLCGICFCKIKSKTIFPIN